jgi:hypothetical protein
MTQVFPVLDGAYEGRKKLKSTIFCRLLTCFHAVSILKVEAMCSSETSVDFQQTTQRYIFINTGKRISNPTDKGLMLRGKMNTLKQIRATDIRKKSCSTEQRSTVVQKFGMRNEQV